VVLRPLGIGQITLELAAQVVDGGVVVGVPQPPHTAIPLQALGQAPDPIDWLEVSWGLTPAQAQEAWAAALNSP